MTSVLIVGGAATGWATAHHLLRLDPQLDVTVIETDPTLKRSSTILSDGNVRIQFNREENIAMSIYAMECLETFATDMAINGWVPDPRPRKQGNLFLVDQAGKDEALAGLTVQQRLGCDSQWLDMDTIASRWPALSSDQLIGGTFGPSDGTIDPSAVVEGYRRKAMAAGANPSKRPSKYSPDPTTTSPGFA
jgi:glycine/D-amino acid oxidase-like deaminating enzyme